MLIRSETPQDVEAIRNLTAAAFAPMRFSDGSEAAAIDQMRAAGDLRLSLVMDLGGVVVGHVAFSDVTLDGQAMGWVGLGPISIRADLQRQGHGAALVGEALKRLKSQGVKGAALTGNPAVYGPMGFVCDGQLHHAGTPDKNVLWYLLAGHPPRGRLQFVKALEG